MADGKSVVPMPDLFGSLTMDIISKVLMPIKTFNIAC